MPDYGKFPNKWSYYTALVLVYATISGTILYHIVHELPWFQPVISAQQCSEISTVVELRIVAGVFSPPEVSATRCQRLRIINDHEKSYWLAFGDHERHQRYPGFAERILRRGQSQEFVLSVAGEYSMHNHFNERMTVPVIVTSE